MSSWSVSHTEKNSGVLPYGLAERQIVAGRRSKLLTGTKRVFWSHTRASPGSRSMSMVTMLAARAAAGWILVMPGLRSLRCQYALKTRTRYSLAAWSMGAAVTLVTWTVTTSLALT